MFLLMGKGSLPQYGQVTVIADIARSGVHMVRSIVALQLLVILGLVSRFFGVTRINLSSF